MMANSERKPYVTQAAAERIRTTLERHHIEYQKAVIDATRANSGDRGHQCP